MMAAMVLSSGDAFVGLRLRRAGRGLRQRPHDRAPRKRDLEVVLALAGRTVEQRVSDLPEDRLARLAADQQLFDVGKAPGLVGPPPQSAGRPRGPRGPP